MRINKTYRMFGGKRYTAFDWCQTKREAEQEKKALMKAGYSVRLTKATEGYMVWRRGKDYSKYGLK